MNAATVKLVLGSQLRAALPDNPASIHCYKSFGQSKFTIYHGRYSPGISISVYGNCTEDDFPEIVASCISVVLEGKREVSKYNTFSLPTTGTVFNRNGDLFAGIEVTETEEAFLIAMYSGDYLAWQVYTDYLEDRGYTLQAMYIRHFINLHLQRVSDANVSTVRANAETPTSNGDDASED